MAKSKNHETKITISGELDRSFGRTIDEAKREITGLYYQGRRQGSMMAGVDSLNSFADETFALVAKASKAVAVGGAGIVAASAAVGMGYEQQMSTVQAIANASEADMERLDAMAQQMGRDTKFSAEEAGEALEYMAMAGWKTDQMLAGLPAILNLAAASGEDLGEVSDIVTDALTAFGLRAEDAAMFSDVLAQASSNSNTNVALMGETFQYVAPVAGAMGFSIQDTAVAIGLMANAGIKGSQAGTALRAMLSRLAKPTKEVSGAMETLDLSITDNEGNMKSLREIMGDVREGFSGLTTAEQTSVAAALAGQEAMSGLLAIANASEADFDKLTAAIDNSTGAAQRMADTRIDNLAGDVTLFLSSAEGAGIAIYDTMDEIMREVVQTGTELMNSFTESDFLEDLAEDMPTYRRMFRDAGESVGEFVDPLINAGEWFLNHPDVLSGSLAGIGTTLLTFKATKGASTLVKTFGSLSRMIGAWPVALVGLAAGGIVGIGTAIRTANREAAKANLEEHFGDITLSLEDLSEVAQDIIDDGTMDKAAEAIMGMEEIESLADSLEDASNNLSRLNWKIGMGFELDETDLDRYQAALDEMVQEAVDVVEQSQYTATVSVQVLFQGSEEGEEILTGLDEMYESLYGQVSQLGKELGDTYSNAIDDGIIDVDEAADIQKLQEKLGNITNAVAQSQLNAKLTTLKWDAAGADLDPETFKNLQAQVEEELEEYERQVDEASQYLLGALDLEYNNPESDMTQAEYLEQKEQIRRQRDTSQMKNRAKGLDWFSDSISSAYGEALDSVKGYAVQELEEAISTMEMDGNGALAWDTKAVGRDLREGLSRDTQDAISQLWEGMEADYEKQQAAVQRAYEAGEAIPQAVLDGLTEASIIGAIAGNENAIWQLLASTAGENEEYQEALLKAQESGYQLPEAVAAAISENSDKVKTETTNLAETAKDDIREQLKEINVNSTVNMFYKLNPVLSGTLKGSSDVLPSAEPDHYASGGLIKRPTLSYFAEESPEMAIPIDGSARSLSLWEETGRLLGAYEQDNYHTVYESITRSEAEASAARDTSNIGRNFAPVYSPTMIFYGDTSRADAEEGGFERFCEWMERYDYEQRRKSL